MTHQLALHRYPFSRAFAVSFVDDTDGAQLKTVTPPYELMKDLGLRSTKTVWALKPTAPSGAARRIDSATATLQDRHYRDYCLGLQRAGFELALHTASAGNNTRDRTVAAYDLFETIFGGPPITNVMHGRNRENLYWAGEHLPSGLWRLASRTHARIASYADRNRFEGHVPDSEYFWGDLCLARTRYVRFFETLRPNTLAFDPATPYSSRHHRFVKFWFSASYAAGTRVFDVLNDHTVEELRRERGASILHIYLCQYSRESPGGCSLMKPFAGLLRRLADQTDGWYVPVATLLDRLRAIRRVRVSSQGPELVFENPTDVELRDVAICGQGGECLRDAKGHPLECDGDRGQFRIGNIPAMGTLRIGALAPVNVAGPNLASEPCYPALVRGAAERILWQHAKRVTQLPWLSRGLRRAGHPIDPPWVADLAQR